MLLLNKIIKFEYHTFKEHYLIPIYWDIFPQVTNPGVKGILSVPMIHVGYNLGAGIF